MQVVFSYIYEFAIEATHFDTLSCVLALLFYLKGYNNFYFYKLSPFLKEAVERISFRVLHHL